MYTEPTMPEQSNMQATALISRRLLPMWTLILSALALICISCSAETPEKSTTCHPEDPPRCDNTASKIIACNQNGTAWVVVEVCSYDQRCCDGACGALQVCASPEADAFRGFSQEADTTDATSQTETLDTSTRVNDTRAPQSDAAQLPDTAALPDTAGTQTPDATTGGQQLDIGVQDTSTSDSVDDTTGNPDATISEDSEAPPPDGAIDAGAQDLLQDSSGDTEDTGPDISPI